MGSPSSRIFVWRHKYNMDKNNEIRFVGQLIFIQILRLIDDFDLRSLVSKHKSDYYYKAYKNRTQSITMLFGILSSCDSMTEICEGLRAMGGKLNHLGLQKAPGKSTASDGLRNRSHKFFEHEFPEPWAFLLPDGSFSFGHYAVVYGM